MDALQVALDAAAGVVGGGDDSGSGGGELGATVGVRHRGIGKFGEAGQALFGVGRETPTPRSGGDRAS